MEERKLTLSNMLSLSRVALVLPFGYGIAAGTEAGRIWAAASMAFAIATDFLDGYLARRLHQVTEFGKIADPLADKISVGLVAVILVFHGSVAWWYLFVVIVRDLLILFGGIYIKKRKNIIVQSNWPGKLAVSWIALVLFLSIFPDATLTTGFQIAFWGSIVMMVFSLGVYAQRLFIGRKIVRSL